MIEDCMSVPAGTTLESDVCIVGGGPAGISVALQLKDSGLRVILLESGALTPEEETQQLYEGHVADAAMHPPLDRYRQRRFGGSSTIWGGRCMPFDPIDFECRPFVDHSGWPINRTDLDPFYAQANRLCEAGDFAYEANSAFPGGMRPMLHGFNGKYFTTEAIERISCPTDFAHRYAHRLRASASVRVLFHANVTELCLDENGQRIALARIKTLGGHSLSVRASSFVLAAGGLEITRLLLASRELRARRIGDLGGHLGRYYMCHIAGIIGTVKVAKAAQGWHGYDLSDEGVYCRRRLALSADAQRTAGVGNFIARLNFPRVTDPEHGNGFLSLLFLAKWLIPYEYGKRLHGGERATALAWLSHLRNVILDAPTTVGFAWHIVRDRILADRKFPSLIFGSPNGLFTMDFHAEQFPNPDSKVTLSDRHDRLGMPQLHVDWRYTRQDVESVTTALRLLSQDLAASGVAEFRFDENEVEQEMTRYGAYGGHHIGTTRMSSDPWKGVVDAQCRVHGCGNLYIASSSVFPTSSQANPTLTIVAIALRIADHILKPLRSSTSASPPVKLESSEAL